ncbi:MAG: site-specific DNA-methyltransferase [Dehalococcoidia bacterium]|nr:site-specific DNA-methyltransferase [Dehalococcoidia bacterium]
MTQTSTTAPEAPNRQLRLPEPGDLNPLFVAGHAMAVLAAVPAETIDCVITSPPYWRHRDYASEGLGQEPTVESYIDALTDICTEVKRVLKPTGSFWLNIGDSYYGKALQGVPWRTAFRLTDVQGWVLRNSVIWNKVKGGPDNSTDKLRNVHELLFHFVKSPQGYYYDADAIRSDPRHTRVVNGRVISATGVSGVRYRRQIELSTSLSADEKRDAIRALDEILSDITVGRLADFRMIIRGSQRTTHSDSAKVSGRARELSDRGFYFLKYHPGGAKPSDVWDILPEDTHGRSRHFAAYPEDLCNIPILATCPPDGIVLDPFCGTGTTNLVARKFGRRSVGIDLSSEYLEHAAQRCRLLI